LRARGARTTPAEGLHAIDAIDLSTVDPRMRATSMLVASDVDNALCGPCGASAVFGPQKGARPEDVARLDAALARTADAIARALGRDLRDVPGAGAAGGVGFALLALGAQIRPGVEIVAELRGLDRALDGASLCLTGEGSIDAQTLHGKTVDGVARHAAARGVPVIAFGGTVEAGVERQLWSRGVACVPTAVGVTTLEEAVRRGRELITASCERVCRALLLE